MKKAFCILTAILLSAAVFVSCEAGKESKQASNESFESVSEAVRDESDISAEAEITVTEIIVTGQAIDEAIDVFYEDEYYEYLFGTLPQHEYVIVKYSDGSTQNVKEALNDGRITLSDLDKFDIEYLKDPKEYTLLRENEQVKSIRMLSLPEEYDYAFDGDAAQEIAEYLRGLTLISDFPENPDLYGGMTWVIEVEYESGECATVYHFGNMFICTDHGKWYKMVHSEAMELDALIEKLK